ncbi:MAG TPA: 5-(carboxyamino)imidazole ribonucleotide synthase [Candidatus Saccharimonadales bacterium]|nr:5-(carboxyamino)imidazole ribonucleotide synthase [Candidatus Saccharimonadales bacterium]
MKGTIGIVGGGQLGRMLSEPAIRLGYNVVVIDPTPDCPASQAGAEQIVADYRDADAVKELAERSDFLTIEFEHINAEALRAVEGSVPVNPTPETIILIQNKYEQKVFLKQQGFPVADFAEIKDIKQAVDLFNEWGGMIIKSKTDSFDGRGNALISDVGDIKQALDKFKGKEIFAEKIVDFTKELAVMVAKDVRGDLLTYPVVETVHKRNICIEVYAPAEIDGPTAQKGREIAKKAVSELKGAGVYGVEMFLDENGQILINEIAPRVHNSGHYTMDMFAPSQFKQHILAIAGERLEEPKATAEYCCMVNILGERNGPVELKGVDEAKKIPGVSVYIYGKKPTKVDRKMGHINALAGTMKEAKDNAKKARKLISI